jgi:hypothetical protein
MEDTKKATVASGVMWPDENCVRDTRIYLKLQVGKLKTAGIESYLFQHFFTL